MKKRFVAFLLVLIMVLGMLPVSAMAADDGISPQALNTGHKIDVTFTVLYVGDEFRIGYNYGASEKTQFVCQYSTPHSDTAYNNHTIAISDIKAAADRASVNSGYQIVGWSKEANANPKTWGFDLKDPTACNKGTTIYLVAKDPNPQVTYTLNYHANGGDENSVPASQTEKSNTGKVTFTVSSKEPTRDGYKFLGWNGNPNDTTVTVKGGNTITTTAKVTNLYAVWESKTPPTDKPVKPGEGDFEKAGLVSVECSTKPADHAKETYDLKKDTFTIGEVEGNATDGYTCEITVTADSYVSSYVATHGAHTLTGDNTKKFTLTWVSGKWVAKEGGVTFPVQCEQTPPPEIPGDQKPNIEEANAKIRVQCIEYPSKHNPYKQNYRILPSSYDDLGWDRTEYGYIYSIRLNRAKYIAQFDQEIGRPHTDTEPNEETRINWRWENGAWHLIDGPDGVTADIKVKCAETPVEPAKPTELDGSFAIVCKNNKATHPHKADYIATPSQYTISDVQMDDQGYYVTATVTVAPNLVAYNTLTGAEHRLVNEQDATLTITFRYDPKATGAETMKWRQQGDLPVVEVICKPKAPTADDLKKLEMAVQVKCVVDASQRHTNAYGLLGEYDEDYFVGEPRKDGDDWLCDINYYPERYVAEFNTTFQNLKHVQNDEKIVPVTLIWAGDSWQLKTQGRVHVTEVYTVTYTDGVENEEVFADQVYSDLRKDSTTPAFNGTPTRTGYTFAGWEPEVAATVTQTVTYVAKWTPVKPTREDIFGALNGLVTVTCINRFWKDGNKNMDCGQGQYAAKAGIVGQDYTLEEGENAGTWVVTFPVTNFVKSFKQDPAHNLYTKDTLSWYIRWEGNTWTSAPVEPGVDDLVKLTHAPTDWREVAKIATGGKSDCIHTSCVNGETGVCDYGITVPFVYFNTDVVSVEPEDGVPGSYIATFKVDRYIDTCAKACNDKNFPDAPRTHKLLTQETVRWRLCATDVEDANDKIGNNVPNHVWEAEPVEAGKDDVCTIAHNWVVTFDPANGGDTFTQDVEYEGKATEPAAPEKTGYTFDGWYLDEAEEPFSFDTTITSDITLTAKWEAKKANVHLMIFKSGDLSKPIVNVPYTTDKLAGDTIDLAEIDPSSYLDFDFEIDGGWYDDGLFNLYKKYVNGEQENKPAALTELQINGNWQNLKLIVTELVPVVYFDSLESLTAYQNDHSKTEGILHTTKARLGSALPTADAPTATREGYTFTFWSREGQTVDVTDQTVNGWTNLYANWEANTYTVTFDPNAKPEVINGTMDSQIFTYDVEQALTANAFTRTGYTFTGWNTAADGTGKAFADKATVKNLTAEPDGTVTLYAQWKANTDTPYTVEHYLEKLDGSYTLDTTEDLKGTTDTTATAAAKSYDNFTYDSTVPDTVASGNIAGDGSLVLKLFYTRNTYDYTVRHIKQLPDGSYDEENAEVETLSGKYESIALVVAKDYSASHHVTNDADTKQNIKVVSGLVIEVRYDLDYHTLTFDTMGGSTIAPVKVRHGLTVAKPTDPTKDKYTFIGWYADPEFTEEYDFATVLEADKTIYAKFELTSTPIGDIYVRYDVLHIKQLPDGSYDLANAEVEHLSAKKDTTVTAVVKDYSATHHINVNSTLSKLTDTAIRPYPGADGKPVYTILSVYYDLDFHTLTFDTMGGSRIDPVTVRHGNAVAKPKDPVNGGYIFDGWYTDKTYRTPYNFATVLTQDTTIYAKWFLITLPGVTIKKTTPKLNTSDHFAYVQGYPDGTVKPTGNITRAETAAILFRLMDEGSRKTYYSTKSGFRDVATGSWYNTYVATLNNAGVITDSSNGYFRPNEAITRAELAAMLANFTETAGAANYFNDVSASYWAANAIAICAKLGWITGYPDGSFRPDRNVTRAELMAMINRATGRAPKSADAFLPGMKTWSDNTADKWYYLDVQEATNSHSYTVKDSEKWTALNADPNWSKYE